MKKIVAKGTKTYGWRKAQAQAADLWYRRFLWLCYRYGSPMAAIGKDADDLWHLHILDTRKYAADCQRIFGHFLNHTPIYGRPNARAIAVFNRTVQRYKEEYGATPIAVVHVSSHSAAT